jgi:hypothetical protein
MILSNSIPKIRENRIERLMCTKETTTDNH